MRLPVYIVATGAITGDVPPGATQVVAHEGGGRTAVDLYGARGPAEAVAASYGPAWSVRPLRDGLEVRRFLALASARHPDWLYVLDPGEDGVSLAFHDAAAILQALCEAPYGAPI